MPRPGLEAAHPLQREEPRQDAHTHRALTETGAPAGAPLEDRAFDPDPGVRALAIRLLAAAGSTVADDVLRPALEDDSADVVVAEGLRLLAELKEEAV